MLQKSPTLTPSLENLSYILRHREWWPDGFEWDYRYHDNCAIGLCNKLWGIDVRTLDDGFRDSELTWEPSMAYNRIFVSPRGKGIRWWDLLVWSPSKLIKKITPDRVADQIDRYLAKNPG